MANVKNRIVLTSTQNLKGAIRRHLTNSNSIRETEVRLNAKAHNIKVGSTRHSLMTALEQIESSVIPN
jgi:hypothetical protein